MDDNEQLWRKRFLGYMGARLAGLIVFFLGIAIAYTDLLREGGWPQVGAIVAILGAIDTLFLPRVIKKRWDRKDSEGR